MACTSGWVLARTPSTTVVAKAALMADTLLPVTP